MCSTGVLRVFSRWSTSFFSLLFSGCSAKVFSKFSPDVLQVFSRWSPPTSESKFPTAEMGSQSKADLYLFSSSSFFYQHAFGETRPQNRFPSISVSVTLLSILIKYVSRPAALKAAAAAVGDFKHRVRGEFGSLRLSVQRGASTWWPNHHSGGSGGKT